LDFLEHIPFPFVACMVGGALLMVPMFGWWPLLGVIAAVVSSMVVVAKLSGGR
jgi:hypothetical protein